MLIANGVTVALPGNSDGGTSRLPCCGVWQDGRAPGWVLSTRSVSCVRAVVALGRKSRLQQRSR